MTPQQAISEIRERLDFLEHQIVFPPNIYQGRCNCEYYRSKTGCWKCPEHGMFIDGVLQT